MRSFLGPRSERGVTLIEMLLVLGIMGVVGAMGAAQIAEVAPVHAGRRRDAPRDVRSSTWPARWP